MQRTPDIGHRVKCRNCGQFMKWDSYTLAKRPDSLRQRDGRSPIECAWHCKCGMWEYQLDPTDPEQS